MLELRRKFQLDDFNIDLAIAHLRLGPLPLLENCHPFLSWNYYADNSAPDWILAHNGQMNTSHLTLNQLHVKGTTDSERTFLYYLEKLNNNTFGQSSSEDFLLFFAAWIKDIVQNKWDDTNSTLNFLISDGSRIIAFKKGSTPRSRLFFIKRNMTSHSNLRRTLTGLRGQIYKKIRRYLLKTVRLWRHISEESLENRINTFFSEWENIITSQATECSTIEICSDPLTNRILKRGSHPIEAWRELQDWECIICQKGKLTEDILDIRDYW